jgi:outer membrane protein assembly factor BamE
MFEKLRISACSVPAYCSFLCCVQRAAAACSYKPSFINEYKIDIQQGNVLTQEMVAQLKPGQTREQVRFILGTPYAHRHFPPAALGLCLSATVTGRPARSSSASSAVFSMRAGRLERSLAMSSG